MNYQEIIDSICDGEIIIDYDKITSFENEKMKFYSDRIKEFFDLFDVLDDNNYMKTGIYIKFYLIYNSLIADNILTNKRDININKIVK